MIDTDNRTEQSVKLSLDTLSQIPADVSRPLYERSSLSKGILHFGPGNFHRSHQGVYLDRLLNLGLDLDWAIVGASVMPGDARLRDVMMQQDLLSTVVTQSATTSEAHISGSMIDYLPVGDTQAILDTLADPAIRIVSLTVTEGGYFVDAATGKFDSGHVAIVADAANISAPKTVFGCIVQGLAGRRDRGEAPFTVMSCDNLPHNGHAARAAVVGLAKLVDESLAEWIDTNSRFPNGMVDRITPATGDFERSRVRSLFGVADDSPVFCEDYIQWVLEDDFVAGRPALERAGVQIVPDVAPYEAMKIRILNGGHAVLAYPAGLLGIEYAHEAMQNELIKGFLEKVQLTEIVSVVPPVPGVDLGEYRASVIERFANPAIGDTITRLCLDGSNRQPKFIVPTLADQLAAGASIDGLALSSAFWCRYCEGVTEAGETIAPNDPSWDLLQATAKASVEDPVAWLKMRDVYGDLGNDARFQESFTRALTGIRRDGVVGMLTRYIKGAE
ncbi:mannitol dehydrogenase family protein [Granulosicoccus antarcticus]|uniref:Mannitol 2-dehydrogenase n=1 Tax=Granulosicoccus antarcticus IMCC3135 TaxID=1192854 RepID=A0A2Z2NYZ2_9GAMM|nr:mannitol dehydrogenase family protein [Granulosicoccus antarcticus]ASJ72354.1 Mannitol 2-dehydrogenase [Granulosicoccus antarcticus IMCC3135]